MAPPQSYVPPPLAVSVTDVAEQVIVPLEGLILATGGAIFWLTTDDAAAVQPLASVRVTVYVPCALAVVDEVLLPLPQLNVPVPVAVMVIDVVVQVSVAAAGDTLNAGAFTFCPITEDAEAVHPLAAVTVTV